MDVKGFKRKGVIVFDSHIPIIWLLVVGGGYCLFPGVIDMPEKCNFTNLLCNESRLLKEDKIIILNIGNELRNRVAGGTFRYLNLQHDPVTDMNKLYWNEEIAHKATMIVSSCPATSQSFIKSHTIIESNHNGIDQIVIKSSIDPTTYQPDNEIPGCEVSSITYQERLTQCAPQKIKERIIRFLSEYGLSIEGRQYDIRDFWIVNRYGEPKLTFRRHESSKLGCSFMIRVSESHYHAYLTCIHCSFNASLPTIGHPGENCPTKFPNLDLKYENLCSDSKSEYDSIEDDQSKVECKNETSLSTNSDSYPTQTTEYGGAFDVSKEENLKEGDNTTSSEPSDTGGAGMGGKTTLPGQMQPVVTSSCKTTIVERNKTSSEVLPVSSSPLATDSPQTITTSKLSSAEISTETRAVDTASQTKIFDQTESILISSIEQILTKEPPATVPVSTSAIAEVENSTLETTTIVYMFTSSVSTFGMADLKTIASTEPQEITTEKQPQVTSSLQTSSHLSSGSTLLAAESTSLAPTSPSETTPNDTATTCKTTYISVSKTADTHYTALPSSSSATAVTQASLSSTEMLSTLSTGLSATDTTKSETTVISTSQESLPNQIETSTQLEKTIKKWTTRRFMTRKKPTTISTELSSTPTTALADAGTQTTLEATVKTTVSPSTVEVVSTSIPKQVDTTFVMSPSQFKITTEKSEAEKFTTPIVSTEFTEFTKYRISSTLHSRISTIGTTGTQPKIPQDSTIISATTCKTVVPGTNTSSTCKTTIPTSKSTAAVPISSASAQLPIQLHSASTTYKTTIPTAKSSFVWPKESTLTSVTTEVTPTLAGQAVETISIKTTESTEMTTLPSTKFSSISSTLKTSSIPSEISIGSLKMSHVTEDLISSTHFTTAAKITDMAIAPMSSESTSNAVIQTSSILTSSETSSSVPEITTSYQESASQAEIISTISPLLKTEITEISTASGQEISSISNQTPVSLLSILSKQTTVIPSTCRTIDSSFESANATCKTTIHSRPPETSISALSSESMPEEKITSSTSPPKTVSTKSTPPEVVSYLPASLAPSTTCRTTTYSTVPSTTTCRTTIPTKELISTTLRTTLESEVIPKLSTTCKTTGTDISKTETISIHTTDMAVPSTTTWKTTASPGISTFFSSSNDATTLETTTCRTTISTLKDTKIQWSNIPTTCRTTSAESTAPTLLSSTCKTTINQHQSASVPSSSSVHSSSEVAGIEFEDATSVTHTSKSLADITESPALVSTPLISTLGQLILPISISKMAWPSTTTCRTTCATTAVTTVVPSTTTCRTTIPTEIPSTSTCKTTVMTDTSSIIPTTIETVASSADSHQSVSFKSDTPPTGLSTTTCKTTGSDTYPTSATTETTTCRTTSLTSTCKTTYNDRPGPSTIKTQGTAFQTEVIPLLSTPLTDQSTVLSSSVDSAVLPEAQISSTTSKLTSVTHISKSYESNSTSLPEQQSTPCKSTTVTPAVTTCKTTIPTTEATTSTCKTTYVTKITFPQIYTGVSSTDLPSTVCQTACISSTIAPSSTKDVGLSTAISESILPAEVTSRTESSFVIAEVISTEKPQTELVTLVSSIETSTCKTTINIRKSSASSQEPILATQQSGIPSQILVSSVSPFSELDIKYTTPITSYSMKPDTSTPPPDTAKLTKSYISTPATSTAEADTSTSATLGTTFVYFNKDKITTEWGPASNQLSTKISTGKFPIQASTLEVSSPLIETISTLLPTSATSKASTEIAVSTTKYSSTIPPLSDYESNVSLMPQEDSTILEQLTTKFAPTKSTCKTTILGSDTSTCKTTLIARSEENEAASVTSSFIPTLIESAAGSSELMAKEQATGSTTIYSTPAITATTCRTTIPTTLVPSTTTCRTTIPTFLPPSTTCRTTVPTALPPTTCKTRIPTSPAIYTTSVYVSTQSPVEVPTEISSTVLSNLLLPTTTTCRTTIPTLLPTSTTCRTTVPTLLPTISTTTCRTTIPTALPTTSTCKTTIPTEFPTTSEPIISTLLPVFNQTPTSFVSPISAATSQVSPLSSSTPFVGSSVPSEEPKNYTCRTTLVSRSEYADSVTIPSISTDRSAKVSQLLDTRIDITTISGQIISHPDQVSTSFTEGLSSRLSTFFSSLIPADWRSHPQTLPTGAYSKGTEQPDMTSIFISSLAPKKDSTYDSSLNSTEDRSDLMAGRIFSSIFTTLKAIPTESTYVTDMAGYIITPPVPDLHNTTAQASTLPSTARTTFGSHRGSTYPPSTVPETTVFPPSYTTPPCRSTVNSTGGTCTTTIVNAATFIPNDTPTESAKNIFDSRNTTGPPSKPKPCLCINWYLICLIFTIAFIFAWCLLCWQKMLL